MCVCVYLCWGLLLKVCLGLVSWIQVLILSTVDEGCVCPEGRNKPKHNSTCKTFDYRGAEVCRPGSQWAGRAGNMTLCLVQHQWSKAFHALKFFHQPSFTAFNVNSIIPFSCLLLFFSVSFPEIFYGPNIP